MQLSSIGRQRAIAYSPASFRWLKTNWPRGQRRGRIAFGSLIADPSWAGIRLFVPSGANWVRPDGLKRKWRVVVGQQATLKADQYLQLPKVPMLWLPS